MAAGATIRLKRKAGAFSASELAEGELGVDTTNLAVYFSTNGTTVERLISARHTIGMIVPHAGFALPNGFLWCDSDLVNYASYQLLLGVIGGAYGKNASVSAPPVVSVTSGSTLITTTGAGAHGLTVGKIILTDAMTYSSGVSLTGTGLDALANLPVYVNEVVSSSSFRVSLTLGGSNISFGSNQTNRAVYDEFQLPDFRGRAPFGRDNLGGSAANRLDSLTLDGEILGETGGADVHTLSIGEIPAHTHDYSRRSVATTVTAGAASRPASALETQATTSAGGGGSHNNLPPLQIVNYIIRAF